MNQTRIFQDNGASATLINWATSRLPDILLILGIAIRSALAIITVLHFFHLFRFIKVDILQYGISVVLGVCAEASFMASSIVSAELRLKKMNGYSWLFIVYTLLGSGVLNGFFLYWSSQTESAWLAMVDSPFQLLTVLIACNMIAILLAEGSGFLRLADIQRENGKTESGKFSENGKRKAETESGKFSENGKRKAETESGNGKVKTESGNGKVKTENKNFTKEDLIFKIRKFFLSENEMLTFVNVIQYDLFSASELSEIVQLAKETAEKWKNGKTKSGKFSENGKRKVETEAENFPKTEKRKNGKESGKTEIKTENMARLGEKHIAILSEIKSGKSDKEISVFLSISTRTIRNRLSEIAEILGMESGKEVRGNAKNILEKIEIEYV